MQTKASDRLFFVIFLVPGLLLYLAFYYYPNISSLIYAFFNWNLARMRDSEFVGLMFFRRLISEREIILKTMYNNVYLTFVGMSISMTMALSISAMVTGGPLKHARDTGFYRSVMYFPNIVPPVATAMMWMFIYSPIYGFAEPILNAIGLSNLTEIPILGNTSLVKPALIVVAMWGMVGFYFIIFLAAMSNIPTHFYEAAEIDGAGSFRQFIHVTLPLVSGTIRTLVILGVATMFSKGFITIKIMTDGGPNRASEILTSYMYQQSFGNGVFGYGAAIGTMIFLSTLVMYFIVNKLLAKTGNYEY